MAKKADKSYSFKQLAWMRLKKNKGAMAGLIVIVLAVLLGIFAYYVSPDHTPDANEMTLELSGKRPGFRVELLAVHKEVPITKVSLWERLLHGAPSAYTFIPISGWKFSGDSVHYRHYVDEDTSVAEYMDMLHIVYPLPTGNRIIKKQAGILFYINESGEMKKVGVAQLEKQIRDHQIFQKTYWLGTDRFGRDILSRIIVGVRVSLSVGLVAVIISLVIGIFLGSIAGYFRGKTDDIVMWLINVVWSVPSLLLVFALTIAIGKGFWQIFIAVGLTLWVSVARIIRGQVMSVREMQYIEAAHAMGFSHLRIIGKHILPNILGPVLVIAANNFAAAIIIEAGLSFLGVGVQPPTPSWGLMLKENYGFIITHNPFLAIVPGIAIMIMVLAFNLLGNGLRDAMDVKGKV
ncbi:MAG: ABC transporter permease [Chitinophagaceae bacterium]|nr:MAG: ABC transporter permease [Chitinophagaceae bacterium]